MPLHFHFLLTAIIGCLQAPAHAAPGAVPQVTATPSLYGGGFPTPLIGAVTPTPLKVSLYNSTFGSNYWPYVATDASGQNTLIPTSLTSDAPFVAQTTNAGNQASSASQSATSAPTSLHSSQTSSTVSTTLVIQTGNMAADRFGSTVGLRRPAAVIVGAAIIIGGAMI